MSSIAPSSSPFCSAIAVDAASVETKTLKHRRRYCKAPDCQRIVKSQGLCQRHGAKPRNCKVHSCCKQAQGNFDGMCKSHFKLSKQAISTATAQQPLAEPEPTLSSTHAVTESAYDRIIPDSIVWKADIGSAVPLVEHLRAGYDQSRSSAWHRNEERVSRGMAPTAKFATELEEWEHELAWTELLLLSGESEDTLRDFAHAWGHDRDFHKVLSKAVCSRRGKCDDCAVPSTTVASSAMAEELTNALSVSDEETSDCMEELLSADFWGEDDESYVEALAMDFTIFGTKMMGGMSTSCDDNIEDHELVTLLVEGH